MHETSISVLDVSEAQIAHDGEATYKVTLVVGEHQLVIPAFCRCGWLVPGASKDLDGTDLSLQGAAQPGGWSVCDGDPYGQNGRLRVGDARDAAYDQPIDVYNSDVGDEEVPPHWVPEWQAAVDAVSELRALLGDMAESNATYVEAVKKAIEVRDAVSTRIARVCDAYQVQCPEPSPAEVFNALPGIVGIEALPVRTGNYRGCGPVMVWLTPDDCQMQYWPERVTPRLSEVLRDAVYREIRSAIEDINADVGNEQ